MLVSQSEASSPVTAARDPFASPRAMLDALVSVGYITDLRTATIVWAAGRKNKPILQEGPAGAGKTQLALSLAAATGMQILRLQCYQGIEEKKAVGEFDFALQQLYANTRRDTGVEISIAELRETTFSDAFFRPGPLVQALKSPDRVILLIDEIDKVPHAFEAMFLEFLGEWKMDVLELGTVEAVTIPYVIITSNHERELGYPLLRRCIYLPVHHPTPIQHARIVARKAPSLSPEAHRFLAGLGIALQQKRVTMTKPPSISEMNALAEFMELMGWDEIRPEDADLVLPYLAKTEADVKKFSSSRDAFAVAIGEARAASEEVSLEDLLQVEQAIASGGNDDDK